jgi:release factor glutamine methyltransferase
VILGAALLEGTRLLEESAVPAPRLTAEVLLAHVLGRERPYLYAHPEDDIGETAWLHFGRALYERLSGKPTQYITGRQEFYGRPFRVTADVLIPRPETEHVVETALGLAPGARRILDVGTGSGAIAVTLALETGAAVWGTDISPAALGVAAANARRLGAMVHLAACDLLGAIAPASFDLVVSNPPYVSTGDAAGLQREVRDFEPHVALFAGENGFAIYDRLVADAPRVLRPGGWLVMELGFKSSEYVAGLLGGAWRDTHIEPDLAGIPRVIAARAPARPNFPTPAGPSAAPTPPPAAR